MRSRNACALFYLLFASLSSLQGAAKELKDPLASQSVEQVTSADLVFEGQVVDIWFDLNRRFEMPLTMALTRVDRAFKGEVESGYILLFYPGGRIKNVTVFVPTAPRLFVGARILAHVRALDHQRAYAVNREGALMMSLPHAPGTVVDGRRSAIVGLTEEGPTLAFCPPTDLWGLPNRACLAHSITWSEAVRSVRRAVRESGFSRATKGRSVTGFRGTTGERSAN